MLVYGTDESMNIPLLKSWRDLVHEPNPNMVLVGINKGEKSRKVSKSQGEELANTLGSN